MAKRYNWKARQQVDVLVHDSPKVSLDIPENHSNQYDESNPLVLPSQKRKTKLIIQKQITRNLLSKKQRKKLEQIVNQRQKKDKRAELIDSLSQVQASQDLLDRLTSISTVQTKGIRRFQQQNDKEYNNHGLGDIHEKKQPRQLVEIISKKARKKRLALLAQKNQVAKKKGPNIVDFEESSTDSESENEMPMDNDKMISIDKQNNNTANNFDKEENTDEIIKPKEKINENKKSKDSNITIEINQNDSEEKLVKNKKRKLNDIEDSKKKSQLKSLNNSEKKLKIKKTKLISEEEHSNEDKKLSEKNVKQLKNKEKTNIDDENNSSVMKTKTNKSKESEKHSKFSPITKLDKNEKKINEINLNSSQTITNEKSPKPQSATTTKTPIFLSRPAKVITSRACLPIISEEQRIIEAISENQVVVICGDTGSGKTTQLPQFLLETHFVDRCIGITQPRRVAATAMARRVAYETGLGCPIVAHSIRYDSTVSRETKIIFMTDGVLLKEMRSDPYLKRYSVIIIDEAHERTLYTDVLLGYLSRLVPKRWKDGDPLRLVIMSATLRVEDFVNNTRLFKNPPPLIKIDARQYPVDLHWSRFTEEDYIRAAYRKVCRIHAELPEGAILVFLTGQREIEQLVRKLRKTYPYSNIKDKSENLNKDNKSKDMKKNEDEQSLTSEDDNDDSEEQFEEELLAQVLGSKRSKRGNDHRKKNKNFIKKKNHLPQVKLDGYSVWEHNNNEDGDFLETDDEINSDMEEQDWLDLEMDKHITNQPLWVLPLYSILPSDKQNKVFEPPPEGCRLCVVATNVAETSLTIPGVKYVVDSGRCKQPIWDTKTGAQAMQITWTSQACAEQRRGRAGRTAPGHCYRLYSSAVFADAMPKHTEPEALRRPIEQLVLQMKSFGTASLETFPFPTPLPIENIKEAERRLLLLGALIIENKKNNTQYSRLTHRGQTMSCLSVSPGHARSLAIVIDEGNKRMTELTILLVSSLSVSQMIMDDASEARKAWGSIKEKGLLGDALISMMALLNAELTIFHNKNLQDFCTKYHIRMTALKEARLLRRQLTKEINAIKPKLELCIDPEMSGPDASDTIYLRQLLLAALPDRIACRDICSPDAKSYSYLCTEMEQSVLLHGSCLFRGQKSPPNWIVYHELFETKPLPSDGALRPKTKMYIRGITAIEPEWLPRLLPSLCRLSEPKSEPPPRWDSKEGVVKASVTGTIGLAAHTLPLTEITLPSGSPESYKWFARFFLEGSVCSPLKQFQCHLLNTPAIIIKPWGKLQPRTDKFFKALVNKGVDCLEKLQTTWKEDNKYLLQEYLLWLDESLHQKVTKMWPPL